MTIRPESQDSKASSSSFSRWLVLSVLLINLFVAVMAGFWLRESRIQDQQQAKITTRNLSRVLEEYIDGAIDKIDVGLLSAADEIKRQYARGGIDERSLNEFLGQQQDHQPEIISLRVTDADGTVRYGRGVQGSQVNVADRDYFLRSRDDADYKMVISGPMFARISKQWAVVIARRLVRPDGGFAGVVYANISLSYLTKAFSTLDVGLRGVVNLRDADFKFMARYPEPEGGIGSIVGKIAIPPDLRKLMEAEPRFGTLITSSILDHIERTYSYRRVDNHPIYVTVGLSTDDYLAEWAKRAEKTFGLVTLFFLTTLSSSWLVLRSWKRQTAFAKALIEQEAKFRTVADYTYDWEYWQGPDRKIVYMTPSCERITGYSQAEFLADPDLVFRIVHPDDRHAMESYLRDAARQDEGAMDFRVVRRDGETLWIAHGYKAVYGDDGKFLGRRVSNRDITYRKRMEEKLLANEQKLRVALSPMNMALFDQDVDLRYTWMYQPQLGYASEEIAGKTDLEILPQEAAQHVYQIKRKVVESGVGAREEVRVVVGEQTYYYDLVVEPTLNANGEVVGITGASLDITERKKTAEALTESELRYKSIFQQAADYILVLEPSSEGPPIIVDASDTAFEKHEYAREELIGKPITFLDSKESGKALSERMALLKKGAAIQLEVERVAKSGKKFAVEAFAKTMVLNGKPFIFSIERDVTARKNAERELRKIEWLLTKSMDSNMRDEKNHGYVPPYGDLVKLNTSGFLAKMVGTRLLQNVAGEFMALLDTSSAVYEKNGDYALGIFSSNWCRFLDAASRNTCDRDDNREALQSGKWMCHESCWTEASKTSIETGKPVDVECNGGIRLYAVPIRAGDEIVGSVNFGYGDPPQDPATLKKLAEEFRVDAEELAKYAAAYESRPPFLIQLAKKRLEVAAELIGEIVRRRQVEEDLREAKENLETRVQERTAEIKSANVALQAEIAGHTRAEKELEAFSYSVSHDLRAPLRSIAGFSEVLSAKAHESLDEKSRHYLDRISASAKHMGKLIDDLLAFSRMARAEMMNAAVNIEQIALEARQSLMGEAEGRDVVWEIERTPPAYGDPAMLKQVMVNLISNALKFSGMRRPAVVKIGCLADDPDELVFYVKDNGAGFDMKYSDQLFGPFQRLHSAGEFEGVGIGLANVRRIINRHGGRTWAEGVVDQGATFYFSLPKKPNANI